MRAYIKQLLREALGGETIFRDVTNIPDYDKLKAGKYDEIPSRYSNMVAYVEHMSPEDYLRECANIQGTTYEQQLKYISDNKVLKLIGLIESGVKLDMPYLNYYDDLQEGRHRAKAAMDMGIDIIPVLVIDDKVEVEGSGDVDWGDVIEINNVKYVTFDVGSWDGINRLLSSIRRNYDYYLLDLSFEYAFWFKDVDDILGGEHNYKLGNWRVELVMKNNGVDRDSAMGIIKKIINYNGDLLYEMMYRVEKDVIGLRIWDVDNYYSSGYEMLVGEKYYKDIKFKSID
jgi:hypothetical protein